MDKIITTLEEFKTVIQRLDAELRCETGSSEIHFYSKDGRIIEYHLQNCDKVKNPKHAKPFNATHEPVNYHA